MKRKMIPIFEGVYVWPEDVKMIDVIEEDVGKITYRRCVGRRFFKKIWNVEEESIRAWQVKVEVDEGFGYPVPYYACPLSNANSGDMVWSSFHGREVCRNQLNNFNECVKSAKEIVERINAAMNEVAK